MKNRGKKTYKHEHREKETEASPSLVGKTKMRKGDGLSFGGFSLDENGERPIVVLYQLGFSLFLRNPLP